MPKVAFDLPNGVSKDVFETNFALYFGSDAQIIEQKGARYIIRASVCPTISSSVVRELREDTAKWRQSDEYKHIEYSQSRVHSRSRHGAGSREGPPSMLRRDSNVTNTVTSAMPAPSQRPGMPHRDSSTTGSVTSSGFGSSYNSTTSYSHSAGYSAQSRYASGAAISTSPGQLNRTLSSSSNSSDYGIDGQWAWGDNNGADGYYGWRDGSRR